jgi:hypothetical protein
MNFSFQDLQTLATLIEFHDDWDECSEVLGVNIEALYDKVMSAMEEVEA